MPAKGRGGKRSATKSANAAPKTPPPKKMKDAGTQGTPPQDEGHVETGQAPHAASASDASRAAGTGGAPEQSSSSAEKSSSAANSSGMHTQGGSGKVGTLVDWTKGTSSMEWDHRPPQSIETPEHLAIVCPPQTQQLIKEGAYVNLACFIPKEQGKTDPPRWSGLFQREL
jgi:hypothetical protein